MLDNTKARTSNTSGFRKTSLAATFRYSSLASMNEDGGNNDLGVGTGFNPASLNLITWVAAGTTQTGLAAVLPYGVTALEPFKQ